MSKADYERYMASTARGADGRFGPGNAGRRVGSRNIISKRLVMAILADFDVHRGAVLARLRRGASYARLVARFLPGAKADRGEDAGIPGRFAGAELGGWRR